MIEHYFISKVRVKVIKLFIFNPNNFFHVREIVRQTDEEINAVRRELLKMKTTKFLDSEPRANRVYYTLDKSFPYLAEFTSIINKEFGLGGKILEKRKELGHIKYAVLGSQYIYRKNQSSATPLLDLLLVGNITMDLITQIVREAELEIGREINYTILSEDQFALQKKRKDGLLADILLRPKTILIGDEESMLQGI